MVEIEDMEQCEVITFEYNVKRIVNCLHLVEPKKTCDDTCHLKSDQSLFTIRSPDLLAIATQFNVLYVPSWPHVITGLSFPL